MEDICRIMRNVEVEMKVWSPAGAHLSALKGALLVAQMIILIATMIILIATVTMTIIFLTYQI